MAHDPKREDYQRLGLRYARTLDSDDPVDAVRAFTTFGSRFMQNRDALPQSDSDRAFHLVVEATSLIDYQLPFAAEAECEGIISRAHGLLDEAIAIDPSCHDARRMKAAATCPSFEAYYQFLEDGADDVERQCLEQRDFELALGDDERASLAADIALRPYLRWLSSQAAKALICGRYRRTIALARKSVELDPKDSSDVRFTAALAFAKLEDEEGLEEFRRGHGSLANARMVEDGWLQLSRLALAHKRNDLAAARRQVSVLLRTYPRSVTTLIRQDELPDGVFSRLAVAPYSEDELILAVSEGTVLLQEGRDLRERGSLGSWLIDEVARQAKVDPASIRGDKDQRGGQAGDQTPPWDDDDGRA